MGRGERRKHEEKRPAKVARGEYWDKFHRVIRRIDQESWEW